ncbi:membrane-bound lytic murein transglycosylase MltF [Sedimentibacter acidaminivorans]|jgi:membrane-bound lytic murein transglycosylase MltF|uniref:Membrane-bound lytic murein transglycosylase MltF n=1 Tax=Sedimentibacter acidaminivorans TaxID=913099 RepID=A0ABS4GHM8_9FIRM|nr:transglycosylase SLT domain-containing protein [Sedimentibacter acidaminivorans]MBP1927202.1 membrane-bound lytic murein transglycosylase MltF [Sedimentibacter acidaminivorans]
MRCKKYLVILFVICFSSYFMMLSMVLTADAEDFYVAANKSTQTIKIESVVNDLRELYLNEQDLKEYISSLTQLSEDECELIIKGSRNNHIDLFIVLGVLKTESNFDPYAVGLSGERGLGQLMENTAIPVAQNLGYEYDPEKLFNPEYNIELTITQLSYLYNLYEKDINKSLTAYNRGKQGLVDYINEGKSPYKNPAMSDYSVKVLKYAYEFKEEFESLMK